MFSVDFLSDKLKVCHISTFGLFELLILKECHLTDLRRHPRWFSLRQVWSWYDYLLPSYRIVVADMLHDLDLWPFDFEQWFYTAGHVVKASTTFDDPMAICSWVLTYDVYHRLSLTMRLQPMRMCHITWPCIGGKFSPHIWNSCPWLVYSLFK